MAKSFDRTRMRHKRIRKKVVGTPERPRLCVHFSGRHVYAQLIDDEAGLTLVSAQTTESTFESKNVRANAATAEKVGQLVAERAKSKHIKKVVFDRGGFLYHGKVKALADAARHGGLQF